MNYIYPMPHTEGWYGGTAAISQKNPQKRTPPDHLEWAQRIADLTENHVLVNDFQHWRQGWRPVPADDAPILRRKGRRIYVRPQSGNGLRHAPDYMDAVLERL